MKFDMPGVSFRASRPASTAGGFSSLTPNSPQAVQKRFKQTLYSFWVDSALRWNSSLAR
jgi:hypothetical protein